MRARARQKEDVTEIEKVMQKQKALREMNTLFAGGPYGPPGHWQRSRGAWGFLAVGWCRGGGVFKKDLVSLEVWES